MGAGGAVGLVCVWGGSQFSRFLLVRVFKPAPTGHPLSIPAPAAFPSIQARMKAVFGGAAREVDGVVVQPPK